MPATGETNNFEGPTCKWSRYPHGNDLGTCKNGCQRAVKEEKGQLDTNRMKGLSCPVKTDDDKSCNVDRSPKATMESCDLSHMVNVSDISTRGLTTLYNVPSCCNLWSMAAPNKIYCFPGHPFGKIDDPCTYNTIEMDNPPTPSTTNVHATAY